MAATVIDELIVKLKLDTSEYDKRASRLDSTVAATGKKADGVSKSVKGLALGITNLARQVAVLLGVGSIGGIVSMLSALTSMETGLRRSAVSTGFSNRELKAWSSTARRLGADAQAGAQAIADLAREQKQFNITGQGPTMQALARMGVRIGPETNIAEALSQAQTIFRAAPAGQRGQIESALAAQGVSADLILMIKSEQDAREVFSRSFAESAEENRKAMDALNDAFESLKNSARNVAMALATVLQPYIQTFADWLKDLSTDGKLLNTVVGALATALKVLADIVQVAAFGYRKLAAVIETLWDKFGGKTVSGAVSRGKDALAEGWRKLVGQAKGEAPVGGGVRLTPEAQARVDAMGAGAGGAGAALGTPQGAMGYLISEHGLTVDQAAAMVANFMGESGLKANAFNPAGGGQGAYGIGQWRGDRLARLRARHGDAPTLQQQLDFAMTDPEERRRMSKAFAAGDNLGAAVSRIYEAHGNAAEDLRRGAMASRLAGEFVGQQINVQTMNVQANSPQQLGQQLQRQSGTQNYSAGVR